MKAKVKAPIEIEYIKDNNAAKKGHKMVQSYSSALMLIRAGVAKATDKKAAEEVAADIKSAEEARKEMEKKAEAKRKEREGK